MSSSFSIVTRVSLLGLLVASLNLLAEDKPGAFTSNAFTLPTTNLFSTNNVDQRRLFKQPESRPREFGVFSPLTPQTPGSFGNKPAESFSTPFVPSPPPSTKDSTDSKKGWIFGKQEDSEKDIFKVKGFTENGKEKKSQSAFAKFVANEGASKEELSRKPLDPRAEKTDTDKLDSRSVQDNSKKESFRDFGGRDTAHSETLDNRPNVGGKVSIFGEFFGGDKAAQDRWAEQSIARRAEFQQLFDSKSSLDPGKTLTASPAVTAAPSDFERPSASSFSDLYRNDPSSLSGRRSSFDDVNPRQLGGRSSSVFSAPTTTRQQFQQPAVLPFPKRPGELFK